TANQVDFVNLIIDYLTQSGWMSATQLYESPFTDYSPKGVEGRMESERPSSGRRSWRDGQAH
ncbi:MAG: hypothetical protein ABSB14_20030, partial [Candidatus Sulfotelmatobacter sp.]